MEKRKLIEDGRQSLSGNRLIIRPELNNRRPQIIIHDLQDTDLLRRYLQSKDLRGYHSLYHQ